MPEKHIVINGEKIAVSCQNPDQFSGCQIWPSMGEYPVYDDFLYKEMLGDDIRNTQYTLAIQSVVRGKTVLEIGTGKDALWARQCITAGAKKVYAIEQSREAYIQASKKVKSLGLEDKITLINDNSRNITFKNRLDVCVSEIIGNIGGSEGADSLISDARNRLLVDDPVIIPERCVTRVAGIELPSSLSKHPGFSVQAVPYVEKIFNYIGHPFNLRICLRHVNRSNIITNDGIFEDLYFSSEKEKAESVKINLEVQRSGKIDGLLMWINLYVNKSKYFVDSLNTFTNWRPVFFPLFRPGYTVVPGDSIEAICESFNYSDPVYPDYTVFGNLWLMDKKKSFHFSSPYRDSRALFRGLEIYKQLFPLGSPSQVSTGLSET